MSPTCCSVWHFEVDAQANRLFLLLLAGLVLLSASVGAEQFVGRASVIDGDRIEIAGQRIRLMGSMLRKAGRPVATRQGGRTTAARMPRS
ncbi:hypothetical protein A6U98_14125 [Rhizobium sp. WYCCWR10014]|nr:hypothetical protein A6U98_14125 [Rhizobium sp. WYCCWR10014]